MLGARILNIAKLEFESVSVEARDWRVFICFGVGMGWGAQAWVGWLVGWLVSCCAGLVCVAPTVHTGGNKQCDELRWQAALAVQQTYPRGTVIYIPFAFLVFLASEKGAMCRAAWARKTRARPDSRVLLGLVNSDYAGSSVLLPLLFLYRHFATPPAISHVWHSCIPTIPPPFSVGRR